MTATRPAARVTSLAIGRSAVLPPLVLLPLLASVVAAALSIGAYPVRPVDIPGILGTAATGSVQDVADPIAATVLLQVRLPRVLLGVVVGAALAVAGALMQGVFRNPLAEPGIIGVSAGAAVGAGLAIVTGVTGLGLLTLPVAAFAGAIAATALVYNLARSRQGPPEVVTLVLTGIAVNAIAGATIGLLTFLSDDAQLRSLTFWSLGSLGSATWQSVALALPPAAVALVVAPRLAGRLDLLALGERTAGHLGVDVRRLRVAAVVLVAALTGAGVAVAGIISFVGLVVPHLVRLWLGPGHRRLLATSGVMGAGVLVLADLVARTIVAPAELPLGVLTGLLGGPFFLWLLLRTRSAQGGWA